MFCFYHWVSHWIFHDIFIQISMTFYPVHMVCTIVHNNLYLGLNIHCCSRSDWHNSSVVFHLASVTFSRVTTCWEGEFSDFFRFQTSNFQVFIIKFTLKNTIFQVFDGRRILQLITVILYGASMKMLHIIHLYNFKLPIILLYCLFSRFFTPKSSILTVFQVCENPLLGFQSINRIYPSF